MPVPIMERGGLTASRLLETPDRDPSRKRPPTEAALLLFYFFLQESNQFLQAPVTLDAPTKPPDPSKEEQDAFQDFKICLNERGRQF
jgi:hypothetical protein